MHRLTRKSLPNAHIARQCTPIVMRDQSTVLYHTNTTYTCISGVYNELTARVTVLTQQIIGINVIGKLLYNTLLVLTRFLKRGGGLNRWCVNLCFTSKKKIDSKIWENKYELIHKDSFKYALGKKQQKFWRQKSLVWENAYIYNCVCA